MSDEPVIYDADDLAWGPDDWSNVRWTHWVATAPSPRRWWHRLFRVWPKDREVGRGGFDD